MPLKKKSGSKSTLSTGDLSAEAQEPWIEAQTRVYTNWINDKLKKSELKVAHLPKDLEDGVVLIKLLEKLSGKKITGKYVESMTCYSSNYY